MREYHLQRQDWIKKWLGSTGNTTCMERGRQEDVASHRLIPSFLPALLHNHEICINIWGFPSLLRVPLHFFASPVFPPSKSLEYLILSQHVLLKVFVHVWARVFATEVYIPGSMMTGVLVEEGEILSLSQVLNNLIMLWLGISFSWSWGLLKFVLWIYQNWKCFGHYFCFPFFSQSPVSFVLG